MPFAKMKRQSFEKELKNYGYACSLLLMVICFGSLAMTFGWPAYAVILPL